MANRRKDLLMVLELMGYGALILLTGYPALFLMKKTMIWMIDARWIHDLSRSSLYAVAVCTFLAYYCALIALEIRLMAWRTQRRARGNLGDPASPDSIFHRNPGSMIIIFEGGAAGMFQTFDWPKTDGVYCYLPFRNPFHSRMHEQLGKNGFAQCSYRRKGATVHFKVVGRPKFRRLKCVDFKSE